MPLVTSQSVSLHILGFFFALCKIEQAKEAKFESLHISGQGCRIVQCYCLKKKKIK